MIAARAKQDDKLVERPAEPFLWRVLPLMFALSIAVMILRLPFFPSQDGPLHLYYVDVLRGLLTHSGPYPQHFAIKSYVTPYAFVYYCLLALETVFPPLLSEKLLVCAYVLTFVLGFQFLAGSVTNSPGKWALAAAIFSLNSFLYLGFLNFLLATALVLVLGGGWLRWMGALTPGRIAILAFVFALDLLTHPLPGAIFLSFAGLHLGVQLVRDVLAPGGTLRQGLRAHARPIAVLAVMGMAAAVWVLSFRDVAPGGIRPYRPGSLAVAIQGLRLMWLAPLLNPLYLAVLQALAGFAALTLVMGWWKRRGRVGAAAITATAAAAVCLVVSCAAPFSVNNSSHFAQRFGLYWVIFLLLAAAAVKPPRACTTAMGILALSAAPVLIVFQSSVLSAAVSQLTASMDVPPAPPGSLGIVVAEPGPGVGLGADLVLWSGAHWFRRSQAILTNDAWLDLPWIMIRPRETYPWTYSNDVRQIPYRLQAGLDQAGALRMAVRVHERGPLTEGLLQGLGFRAVTSAPEIAFYSRP